MTTATGTRKAVNIFSNPQHAQFLAAAASTASVPKLHGVPEVSEGKRIRVLTLLFLNDPCRLL